MTAQNLITDLERQHNAQPRWAREDLFVASCSLAIIGALVLGVGIVSHLALRHIVQTMPLWVPVILGFRRSDTAGWAALPLFLFWLLLMTFIWLYLLGVSNLLSGHFTELEIAMTIVVGIASCGGVVACFRLKSNLSGWGRVGIFIVLASVQIICFRLSFLPAIAHR